MKSTISQGGDMPAEYTFSYRPFAEALYAALTEDGFYITLERSVADPARRREAMLRYLDYSMVEAEKYGILHIPPEHEYGASIWARPLPQIAAEEMKAARISFLRDYMGADSEDTYNQIVASMSAQSATVVDNAYWYLSIVGVLPEYQNRGLGVPLVNDVLRQTDDLGVPTYLETFTPRNERFYQRLGYTAAGSFFVPVIGDSYTVMLRPAHGQPAA